MSTTAIALQNLRPGEKAKGGNINSRRTAIPLDGLVTSILRHGLLVPLIVRQSVIPGAWDVIAGNRRLAALTKLQKDKAEVPGVDWHAIPCVERDREDNALEISLIENVERAQLHPVDEFEVLYELVRAGMSIEEAGKRRNMTIKQVRQALALGRMSPAVREAWRTEKISAEATEAFTATKDHAAQDRALKKAGEHADAWNIRQALAYASEHRLDSMLKFVGRDVYEAAGHEINASLFTGEDGDDGPDVVSDVPALIAMVDRKLSDECDRLTKAGWKWAVTVADAPKDWRSWKRIHGNLTKEQKGTAGVIVDLSYTSAIEHQSGLVKPGDKTVAQPKSPKAKKADAKKRAEKKVETGGITNALAWRLSQQLTAAVREAMPGNIVPDHAFALAIAVLAASNEATPSVKISDSDDGGRFNNEFAKYLKLANSKTLREKADLLMTWIAKAVDLVVHDGGRLNAHLHPGKSDPPDVKLLVDLIDERKFTNACVKHFDAKDYFASVGKPMIVEAVTEAMGKEHGSKVAKMKTGDAAKFAIANLPKTGWVPIAFRVKG